MLVNEYFHDHELACRCGCGLMPPDDSVERLYALRILLGKPIHINSAARCKAHNVSVGGAENSTHLRTWEREGEMAVYGGCGFDIATDSDMQIEIVRVGLVCGFRGFGFGDTFIHIDDAARPVLKQWRYA